MSCERNMSCGNVVYGSVKGQCYKRLCHAKGIFRVVVVYGSVKGQCCKRICHARGICRVV